MARRKKSHSRVTLHKLPIEHNGFYPYLVRYLEWTLVKGYSSETARRKDSAIRRFIVWCDERSLNDPKEITKPMLERYQSHLFYYRKDDGETLAYSTQHVFMSSVKVFFKWLTQENHIPSNPASEVQAIKRPKRLPQEVLSVDEVNAVLNAIDTETPEGIRDRAMIELLYSTGIRRSELCRIKNQDIDVKRQSLMVREGKGGKDRYLPVGERAVAWLTKYKDDVRPLLVMPEDDSSLFLTDYGEAYNGANAGRLVKHYLTLAGIEREGSCHLFRHAMATHMLDNGADLRFIQLMLGHSDINSTTIYTQLSIEKMRKVHAATHPASLKS